MAGCVSLKPESFAEGGGLLDDCDVEFGVAKFIMGDYGGKSAVRVPMLSLDVKVLGGDDDETHTQFYSVGGKDDFAPSDDGKSLMATGSKAAIVKTSNFGELIRSLVDAGFPPSQIKDDDVGFLTGVRAHMKRKAMDRKGLADGGKKDGREQTTLLVEKLLDTPKAGGKGKASGGKASAEVDEELMTAITEVITLILVNNDGTIAKKDILSKVLKMDEVKGSPVKNKIVQNITKDAVLGAVPGVVFADGVLTLAQD